MLSCSAVPHLVQTVGDEREDKETAESSEEPDPPGYPRLPGLAGDDGGGHTVSLKTKVIRVEVFLFLEIKRQTWKARCLSSTRNGSFVTRVTSLEEIFTFSA